MSTASMTSSRIFRKLVFASCTAGAALLLFRSIPPMAVNHRPYSPPVHRDGQFSNATKEKYRRSFKFSLEPRSYKRRMPQRFWENKRNERGSEFDFVLLPTKPFCNPEHWLLLVVKSAVAHFNERMSLRNVLAKIKSSQLRIIFVLGKDSSANYNAVQESKFYNDIVVGNFEDTYANLTIKTLLSLKFVTRFCRDVKFIASVDDDVVMSISGIINYITALEANKNVVHCGDHLNKAAKVTRKGKWAIQIAKYDTTYYPPYCNGVCYIMSYEAASALHEMSLVTPSDIPIDDALITGILREKARIDLEKMPRGLCEHHSKR